MKIKMIIMILIICSITLTGIYGEKMGDSVNRTSEDAEASRDREITRKVYPRLKHPPGYYQGILLLSASMGNIFSPTGSFISHEKEYDKSVQYGIESGNYRNILTDVGFPNYYFQPEYTPQNNRQFDIEYGITNYFGLGFSNLRYRIDSERQDVIYGSDKFGQISYEPFPVQKVLFQGNAFMILTTLHPFPKKILDPYIILRGGIVKFSGNAHSGLYYDSHKTSSLISNGMGKIVSAGLGMNFFIAPELGLKMEGDFSRAFLNSDEMSGRILNTYSVQIGIFINYSAIAASIAYENR